MSPICGRCRLGIRTSTQLDAWVMRVRCAAVISPLLTGMPPRRSRNARMGGVNVQKVGHQVIFDST